MLVPFLRCNEVMASNNQITEEFPDKPWSLNSSDAKKARRKQKLVDENSSLKEQAAQQTAQIENLITVVNELQSAAGRLPRHPGEQQKLVDENSSVKKQVTQQHVQIEKT